MFALQSEGGASVVKLNVSPPMGVAVALVAGAIRIKVRFQKPRVRVIVTVRTTDADVSELPFGGNTARIVGFQMAGQTRGRLVCTGQRKTRVLVRFRIEQAACKVFYVVAAGTIGFPTPAVGKLVLVVVAVTIRAGLVGQRLGKAFRVAFPAVHRGVFTGQRKTRQSVVEVFDICHFSEGFLVVAGGTVCPKCLLMDIFMAYGAFIRFGIYPILKYGGRGSGCHLMTGGTIRLPVSAFQRKTGFLMIERF